MRWVLRALIIACLAQTVGWSQSLADLARLERARRARLPEKGPLITSEEAALSDVMLSFGWDAATDEIADSVEAEAVEEADEAAVQPGALPAEADTADALAADTARIEAQRDRVADLDARIVAQRLEVSRLEDLFTGATGSGRERSQAQVEHAAAATELENLEAELVEAENLLETLLGAGAP